MYTFIPCFTIDYKEYISQQKLSNRLIKILTRQLHESKCVTAGLLCILIHRTTCVFFEANGTSDSKEQVHVIWTPLFQYEKNTTCIIHVNRGFSENKSTTVGDGVNTSDPKCFQFLWKRIYILTGRIINSTMEEAIAPNTFEQINGHLEFTKITNPQYTKLNVQLNSVKFSLL